jgi:hypothetical protein
MGALDTAPPGKWKIYEELDHTGRIWGNHSTFLRELGVWSNAVKDWQGMDYSPGFT